MTAVDAPPVAEATVTTAVPTPAGAMSVLRRGFAEAPELRVGIGRTLALALVAGGGKVVVPVLVQRALDAVDDPGRPALWPLAAIGVVAVALTGVAAATTQRRLITSAERALCGLRVRAFRHVHRLSLADLAEEQRGVLVGRVTSDVETISQFLAWGGISWVVNGALWLVTLTVMVVYDWRLAVVAVTTIAPLYLFLRALQRRLIGAYDTLRTQVGETLGALNEALTGYAVIRAHAAQAETAARVEEVVRRRRKADIRAGTIGALLFPTGDVCSVVTTSAVLLVGVRLGQGAGLSSGEVVAFAFLVGLFLQPVAEFTEILDQTQMAVAGWRKVLDLLDLPVEVPEPAADVAVPLPTGEPLAVAVDHVSFRYPTGGVVLDDVSFTVRPGARVALVGATGSGKSTLAKLLARFADPVEGTVLVGGVDLRVAEAGSLRRSIVVVPQEVFLFDDTVGGNVRFARPSATAADVFDAFARLGLADWLALLPHGLDTPVGERGESLSVGERQLVALARAALAAPGVLVLDEATSAVDPATEVRVTRALERLAAGRTSITVAHRLATAARADWILVLEHGRLVEQGDHLALVAAGGAYAALYRRWLEVATG